MDWLKSLIELIIEPIELQYLLIEFLIEPIELQYFPRYTLVLLFKPLHILLDHSKVNLLGIIVY